MKKGFVSQGEYKSEAQAAGSLIQRQAEKLSDIARNLNVSADFSPCTIDAMRNALAEIDGLRATLKHMVGVSVNRGCTHFEEQKAKLLDGTLRLNRRQREDDIDKAAE